MAHRPLRDRSAFLREGVQGPLGSSQNLAAEFDVLELIAVPCEKAPMPALR